MEYIHKTNFAIFWIVLFLTIINKDGTNTIPPTMNISGNSYPVSKYKYIGQ